MSAAALALVPLSRLGSGCDRNAPALGQAENLGLCRCDCPTPDADGDVQCPWVSCRYHLAIDVHLDTGTLRSPAHETGLTIGTRYDRDQDPDAWMGGVLEWMEARANHCALAAARKGSRTLQEVAEIMGCTRERIRQIEAAIQRRLRRDREVRALAERGHLTPSEDVEGLSAHALRVGRRQSTY